MGNSVRTIRAASFVELSPLLEAMLGIQGFRRLLGFRGSEASGDMEASAVVRIPDIPARPIKEPRAGVASWHERACSILRLNLSLETLLVKKWHGRQSPVPTYNFQFPPFWLRHKASFST